MESAENESSGRGNSFPTTDWGLLADCRGGSSAARLAAIDILIRRYWKPAFLFLRYSGADVEASKDSTQAFFADWIKNDVFSKADERKGHFRSFMLTCLKRFTSNARRAGSAQKRVPSEGLLSLDELMSNPEMPFEPSDPMTPESAFQRAWACEVVQRVLRHLEIECARTGKHVHFDLFARRIIHPILEGAAEPPLANLGAAHGITEKQAANHLLTAKRAYQRLLQEEVRLYADTEAEVASEIRDIFKILAEK